MRSTPRPFFLDGGVFITDLSQEKLSFELNGFKQGENPDSFQMT